MLDHGAQALVTLLVQQLIGLVQHQPAIPLGQRRTEARQLLDDGRCRFGRIGLVQRRHVHQMQEQTGARQVLEEANPQASALGSALDQAGDIGNHEALVATDTDHPQVGHQGGKGIIRHFGLGRRDGTDEGALARIGQTKQPHIGQHFELQLEIARLTRLARRGLTRRTVGARLETAIAQPVPAALSHQQALPRLDQVANDFLGGGIDHRGSHRHRQLQIITLAPGTVTATTILPALGIETAGIAIVHQGIEVLVSHQEDRAAIAAIAAVGAALLDKFLATEAHAAIAAVARFHVYGYFIDEFHLGASRQAAGQKQQKNTVRPTAGLQTKKPRRKTGLFQQART